MSRRALVLAWLAASTIPMALAIVLVGCCALPFHGLVHRLLPLCQMAETALTAHHHDEGDHGRPPAPAPEKRDSHDGQRWVSRSEPRVAPFVVAEASSLRELPLGVLQRSQTAPGAFRCDDDVGRRLALLDTLRI